MCVMRRRAAVGDPGVATTVAHLRIPLLSPRQGCVAARCGAALGSERSASVGPVGTSVPPSPPLASAVQLERSSQGRFYLAKSCAPR